MSFSKATLQSSLSHPKDNDLLAPLLTEPNALRSAYRRRRDLFDYVKVQPADEAERTKGGWELHQRLKGVLWMKKAKSWDRRLEDRVWCLMHRMGYPVLGGEKFKIKYQRHNGSVGQKQVEVFAKDDETTLVIECNSREVRGRRSLQKDIHETHTLQKPIAESVRTQFGEKFNAKILWLYVTENIILDESDLERRIVPLCLKRMKRGAGSL
jgi:DNA sulfur modification protein DndB